MNVLSKLRVPFVALALAAAGSAGAVGECPKGLVPVTEFRLFFGLADAAGKVAKAPLGPFLRQHRIPACLRNLLCPGWKRRLPPFAASDLMVP